MSPPRPAFQRPGSITSLREAHAHLASFGESLGIPTLENCGSVAECLHRVEVEAQASVARWHGTGAAGVNRPFIRFTSARVEGWTEGRWPTLAELNRAASVRMDDGSFEVLPVVLFSFDHHAAAANTAALAAAGLKAGVPVPPNGVVCTGADGQPTGVLLEQAAYAAWSAAPAPTMEQHRAHVRDALMALAAMGYTEVHDLHSQPWLGAVLGDLDRAGELMMDVWVYPPVRELESVVAGSGSWEGGRVRLAGGKLFADGTLNCRTALMLHEYRDAMPGMPRGKAMVTEAELDEAVALCQRLGVGLATHAIGDGAVRMVLDAYERAGVGRRRRDGAGGRGVWRIEHCELIDERDVPRFAGLGVVCSVQPCHLLADMEALERYLPHRLDRVLPLRELLDEGAEVWFGSDVPIVRADPEDSIQAAVERRRVGMGRERAIGWEQRISEVEAWRAFGGGH